MVAVPRGTPGLREEQGLAGPFSFVPSTLGLCSCLALFDRWDQEHGWGGQYGLESPTQGRPEPWGRGGKERLESPSGAQLSLGTFLSWRSLTCTLEAAVHWLGIGSFPRKHLTQQPMGSLGVSPCGTMTGRGNVGRRKHGSESRVKRNI